MIMSPKYKVFSLNQLTSEILNFEGITNEER